jgi:hypothetical protein
VKIDHPVECPLRNLDMARYMTGHSAAQRSSDWGGSSSPSEAAVGDAAALQYDLFAIVEHIGSMEAGHYIAFVKKAGRWLPPPPSRWLLAAAGVPCPPKNRMWRGGVRGLR